MFMLLIAALAAAVLPDYSHFQVTEAEEQQVTTVGYQRCMEEWAAGGGPGAATECIREESDHIDRMLNVNYHGALAKMPSTRMRQQLRNAQRSWLRDLDDECSIEELGGHTPYEFALHSCQFEERIRRVVWLRHLAHRK